MRRRKFIKKTGVSLFATWIGAEIVYASHLPQAYLPIISSNDPSKLFGKSKEMIVLSDRPWNIETPPHLLADSVTPASKMFVRNNGIIPLEIDPIKWMLTIDGESVSQTKSYTLAEIKSKFRIYTYQVTLECGGNGRGEFDPPTTGNQWGIGAVSSAKWTGIRLRDLLNDVGIKNDAVYIGYYGADSHLSGDPNKSPISRGVPLFKAMEDETLIAFQMNGEDIPLAHGYPLRLVVGGWPASVSGKWLNRISVRNKTHDGEKMLGDSYKVPCESVAPGEKVLPENMCIIESMPVRSVISHPKTGAELKGNKSLIIFGHAWAGDKKVSAVNFSIDFGATWHPCKLMNPTNRFAWQHFEAEVNFPKSGYYEIWAMATDEDNVAQPMVIPGWNPSGYLNNACHRIAIRVLN